MKNLAAVVLNFFFDVASNTYLAVALVAIVALLFNSAFRKLSMRNLGLREQVEPEIQAIHEKYGFNNTKSQIKISEVINKYNYVVYASIFLSLLQFLEGWAFMSGFKSELIYPVMVRPESLQMYKSVKDLWVEGSPNLPYVAGILLLAMILQRANDVIIEKNLIGDQVLADYIVLVLITVASAFIPAYIFVYWIATEIVELILMLNYLRKPPELKIKDKKSKKSK